MKNLININDKFVTNDMKGLLEGEVIFGVGRHQVEFINPYGKKDYTTEFDKVLFRGTNVVPIGAYQFAFDKLFNIGLDEESPLRVGDLNDESPQMKIGVSRGEYNSTYYDTEISSTNGKLIARRGINISALNFIFGFMIGDGGSKEDNMTVISPDYKNRELYRAIPFRMTTDTSTVPSGKYFGRSVSYSESGIPITSYYVKKFDDPNPHIVHRWATENTKDISLVDDSVFSSTSTTKIESYVEICMSIDEDDAREFFTFTETTPRINEFALVSGWYNDQKDDYESLRLFTHYTRPSLALVEGDSIEAIYRLHAR